MLCITTHSRFILRIKTSLRRCISISYTKPVITEPYHECPVWMESEIELKEYICLSPESSEHDVELFLMHLFGYNNIDVKQSMNASFDELLQKDTVAISGGVAFFENEENYIMPSCCCGLEEWGTVYTSIRNRISPWMGHDPSPGITYLDDYVRVWSDDPESNIKTKLTFIDFSYSEVLKSLARTKADLIGFIENPLFSWISKRDIELAIKFKLKMYQWFMEDVIESNS